MTTCLLYLAAGLGYAAADGQDVVYTRERAFRIPLEISDAERKSAAWIRLMVSTDGGKTWNRVREESPKRPTVTFRAPGDGQYWLALAVVGHDEKMHPANPADLKPGLKVVIDSSKPEVTLEAVKTRSGLRGVRWTVKDGSPEDKMTLKCAVWDERAKAWKPRSLNEMRNNTVWFGRSEVIGKMQLLVADVSGNEAVEQIDIDGDRFLCSDQQAFALATKAPTPAQFAENAKPRPEPQTSSEVEQAGMKATQGSERPAAKKESNSTPIALADAAPLPSTKAAKTTTAKPKEADDLPVLPDEPAPARKASKELVADAAKSKTDAEPRPKAEAVAEPKAPPVAKKQTPKKSESMPEPVAADAKPAKKTVEADAEIDVSYSNRRTTVLHYEMTAIPKGEAVELWGRKEGSKEWARLGRDEDGASPMEALFPSEGRWGVTLVVGDESGSGRPAKDDPPSTWVDVDTTRPRVDFQGIREEKNRIRIIWKATDSNIVEDSVRLSYARDPAGPWQTIAVQLATDCEFLWKPSEEAMAKPIYFKLDATDRAGNIGSATTSKSFRRGGVDADEAGGVDRPARKSTKDNLDVPVKDE
jgi:hypothetical protein